MSIISNLFSDMLSNRIVDAIEKYHKGFSRIKVLKTTEEVEANTNDTNVVGATVAAEIIDNLKLQPEWITDDATGKITGYRFRGADTVFPFSSLENFVRINSLTSNTSSPYVDFSVVPGTWRGFHGQYPETVFYKVVNSPNDNTYWVGTGSKINIKLKKEIRAMALSIYNYDYKAGNVFPALIKNISNVTKICDYAVFSPICGVGGTISIDFCASPEWLEINDFSLYILL